MYLFLQLVNWYTFYLSIKENHLSFEHTHPPHHYILSNDRFKVISNLKKKFKKIVDENAFKK